MRQPLSWSVQSRRFGYQGETKQRRVCCRNDMWRGTQRLETSVLGSACRLQKPMTLFPTTEFTSSGSLPTNSSTQLDILWDICFKSIHHDIRLDVHTVVWLISPSLSYISCSSHLVLSVSLTNRCAGEPAES
jgi:hypothetical protein